MVSTSTPPASLSLSPITNELPRLVSLEVSVLSSYWYYGYSSIHLLSLILAGFTPTYYIIRALRLISPFRLLISCRRMTTHIPKATLYYFPGSVWASVPLLTAEEKGFGEDVLEKRLVDLLKGDNFNPAFLKISPRGTVPALVAPYEHTTDPEIPTKYKSLTETTEICQFLDTSTSRSSQFSAPSLSPATVQGNSEAQFWIDHVHSHTDAADPNAFMLSFRNDQEREAKLNGLPGAFLKGRQEALIRFQKEAGEADQRLKAFYETKIKENGGLLAMLKREADPSPFFEVSKGMYVTLAKTVALVEDKLRAAFLIGDQISLADLHVGAYFARILGSVGATSISDLEGSIEKLDAALKEQNVKVGPKSKAYLSNLFERDSFKKVYADGLH